jgi:hypothetical protein
VRAYATDPARSEALLRDTLGFSGGEDGRWEVRGDQRGGFYAYENHDEQRDLGTLCSGSTDAQGRLACDAALQVSGEVELIAKAQDDAGRRAALGASRL